jgi:hypothetical protein
MHNALYTSARYGIPACSFCSRRDGHPYLPARAFHLPATHGNRTFFMQVIIQDRKVTVRTPDRPVRHILPGNVQAIAFKLLLLAVERTTLTYLAFITAASNGERRGLPLTGTPDAVPLRSHPSSSQHILSHGVPPLRPLPG